ncbi:MAG: NADH-quinone oxidoreductase subunit G [Helicobacteraceae bacterium]|jgi:NADH-quinone oxidoreductase subunit G|nr:NADH-quinone oxidoreductase subunit G [Helicobacteraceae bacterium]
MAEVKFTIDDRAIVANDGDSVLNIARANGIYIPAICYLTRCSPTLACRLCMAEADGKRVYTCNAKPKEAMVVKTSTPEIEAERREIMQAYIVNHPLQCGVCDKSGECELQNNALFQEVSEQLYAIKDTPRKAISRGKTRYDPALCIVCERCVTVCKDMIGVAALATTPRGGDPLPESYKETMGKDAYTIWNKANKSLIGHSARGDLCDNCGECAAVCPTGAMIAGDFQYKSNAWELTRVPSSCAHCPSVCEIFYEVKQGGIDDPEGKIYRVTNDFHFQSLCGKGRFDFAGAVAAQKDKAKLAAAIEAFKRAKTIIFTSKATNEEIAILNRLKQRLKARLVNDDAFKLANFLSAFEAASGKKTPSGERKNIEGLILSLGLNLSADNANLRYAVNNALVIKKSAAIDFHHLSDPVTDAMHKNFAPMRAKEGEEEIVIAKVLNHFASDLPAEIKKRIAKNVFSDAEIEQINKLSEGKTTFAFIAGGELYTHKEAENIAKLLGLLEKYTKFKVILSPKYANSLGAALYARLDEKADGFTIGFETKGDFTLGADGDLAMPHITQKEGTMIGVGKHLAVLGAALDYAGYDLVDIYSELTGNAVESVTELSNDFGEIARKG